ncbi:MAG: 4'-phosphopantetheinyl transferase superfamily protein [Clostridia bacterium]|nr:4'-phosphopantetheinyl transferase superfamily protein [Clostridia bacterium]
MIKLFLTSAEGIYDRLNEILRDMLGYTPEIKRTAAGKPFIGGNPLYFSVTHSGRRGAIAIAEKPVGVDLELFKGELHALVKNSFPKEEQDEITCERDFLRHWTVREAFVKMHGKTLAETLKNLQYCGANLYFNGELQAVEIFTHALDNGILTVCTEK